MSSALIHSIDWNASPLLPVVVQDVKSGEVLMLAYMNQEALSLTLQTRFAHYYSRSRQSLWKKGETSGHVQHVKEAYLDCDSDTLLLKVEQEGVACHTGRMSCFFNRIDVEETPKEPAKEIEAYSISDKIYHIIQERKKADPKTSYVASLLHKGDNSILKKVVEEAGEFCFAFKDNDNKEIIYEAADLMFHALVALGAKNIHPSLISKELERRFGLSGIEEKNSRNEH
ncbi:bifunctional phosphoribosyl-AMP cyclohydrolase/phosphoribosyl-ATP diphosphatase HisIE [Sulfurospirillum diekertiae]|uniref:Histidine biosynthesis bifunctional protein HisIE n=1 Tax=Sulfurospirillum diekertiae TaxID=1854492 RepID=A0A6G9VT87_9BACT|nr:bifunctional phosphoribosyl-AMP cyclohydrolase/phosphoribosyl-ATP diphosphatase HisIE [Sulfurospirillum diekertiae]QIR76205.1 bifunctional phosphoribosyl-AMP cyclohydrolase/phosphoribosyl-ATP diphosphatase HisIE [Sulfurospirillum diekertiae]QIR78833.1 bifunctional phosphoribosyl-AMP cyclohydrolase/phosphoribosyl-ATP diphosphatase HisIE [Sulfurospirillum diekertiae]